MEGLLPELSDNFAIRRASIDDLPEIVRLMADDELGSRRERFERPLPSSYTQAFAAIEADPNNELVVAAIGDKIVGTLQLTYIPYLSYQGSRRAMVESVRIDRELRSQGFGNRLMDWAIARARRQGCNMLQLASNKTRRDAHRFYERLGFVASHEGMKLMLS